MTLAANSISLPRPDLPRGLFALIGMAGLWLPFLVHKPNRIVAGQPVHFWEIPMGAATLMVVVALLAAMALRIDERWRVIGAFCGAGLVLWHLGVAAQSLVAADEPVQRVSAGSGVWLLALCFVLIGADAVARLGLTIRARLLLLLVLVTGLALVLASGHLDRLSVMREFSQRQGPFWRETQRHLLLSFASLGAALVVGIPLGLLIFRHMRLRSGVLAALNLLQTIPSLALFGMMIPLLGWAVAVLPRLGEWGVAGIGVAPALIALFLYSLLPVVGNTLAGLTGVPVAARDAGRALGMTEAQLLIRVQIPLALPVLLAAVRIVLVQNIGLAVIAGLIGGGGYGTFVFQGLSQNANDLVLLGAVPTVALALVAGILLDLMVEGARR